MALVSRLAEVARYHEVIGNFVSQDLQVRYQRSFLGMLWTLLKPVMMIAILTVVFATLLRRDFKNFAVYLGAGLVAWELFSQTATTATTSIVRRGGPFFTKVYLPKAIFPFAMTFAALLNSLFFMAALLIVVLALGHPLTLWLLLLPYAILCFVVFCLGVSLWLACLTVYLRDLEHLVDVLLRAWFYLTPILYPLDAIPEKYWFLFKLNPMYHFVHLFQACIYYGREPDFLSMVCAPAIALFVFFSGAAVFFWRERDFVFLV